MRNILMISALFAIASTVFFSCDKEDTPDPNVTFKATLNGASESTPNASAATGDATLTFNKNTKIFTVTVNFTGMTASVSHIHVGAVGVAGPIVFGFPNPITSPINYTSVALDATQEADLNNHLYYVNVHSTTFPGGEIRGQLIKQ